MNPNILKNCTRNKLVDALIIGGNVVRWALHQFEEPAIPLQPASIRYYEGGELSEPQDERLIA